MQGYELGKKIGKGAMGDVYAGRHTGLNRNVAIKVLKPSLADDDEFVQRFLDEARLCALFDHPNIVRVYDVGKDANGVPYLIMDLLVGQTLKERIEQGPLSEKDAATIACAILSALEHAHAHDIVHRDMKPSNVFLSGQNGQAVKVMDFGVAKALNQSGLTNTGVLIGSPAYMSPEQAEGRAVDARTDLYGVGILLYEMLTGDVPFKADTQLSVLHMQIHTPLPPLPASVSPWLRAIVARALAKNPKERFASTADMRLALERGLAGKDEGKVVKPAPVAWPKWALGGVGTLLALGLLFTQINTKHPDTPPSSTGATVPTVPATGANVTTAPAGNATTPVPNAQSGAEVPKSGGAVSVSSAVGSVTTPSAALKSQADLQQEQEAKEALARTKAELRIANARLAAQQAKARVDEAGAIIKKYQQHGGNLAVARRAIEDACGQALRDCNAAIEADPHNREAWRQRIRALHILARAKEHKEAIAQALQLFPGDAELLKEQREANH